LQGGGGVPLKKVAMSSLGILEDKNLELGEKKKGESMSLCVGRTFALPLNMEGGGQGKGTKKAWGGGKRYCVISWGEKKEEGVLGATGT